MALKPKNGIIRVPYRTTSNPANQKPRKINLPKTANTPWYGTEPQNRPQRASVPQNPGTEPTQNDCHPLSTTATRHRTCLEQSSPTQHHIRLADCKVTVLGEQVHEIQMLDAVTLLG